MAKTFVMSTRGGDHSAHVTRAIANLNDESDRAAAIVGGSIIEIALTQALVAYMHPNEKITDDLFRFSGALGSFASKIDLGFLIGLYGREAHRDLITVKDIRNAFAHSLAIQDFRDQKPRALALNLEMAEKYSVEACGDRPSRVLPGSIGVEDRDEMLKDPRERFLVETQVLTFQLAEPFESAMPDPLF